MNKKYLIINNFRSGTPGNWSLSELVYAIVLMAHFHSMSSFIGKNVDFVDAWFSRISILYSFMGLQTLLLSFFFSLLYLPQWIEKKYSTCWILKFFFVYFLSVFQSTQCQICDLISELSSSNFFQLSDLIQV